MKEIGLKLGSNFLPDKIHYQQLDKLGRVEKLLVDADAKTSTGKTQPDGSGANVRGIDQVIAYERNVKGEVTEMKRDNNVDGTYDYRERYTLNANGGWTEKYIDLTNDGTFDRKEVYTKEADDGLVKTHFYNLVDGKEVLTKIEDYTLNANNQRTSVKVDTLGDGTTDAITRYELDELGRTAKAYFDTNGDGTVDRIEAYTRDTNGHILRTEISDAQGVIQSVRTYERNALGQALEYNVDLGNDGVIDERYTYTRDINGNEQAYQYYSYNSSTSQLELFRSAERTFNELDQRATQKTINNNGTVDSVIFTYDEYGRTVEEHITSTNGNNSSNRVSKYAYYPDNLLYSREDYNESGNLTGKTVYTEYDPQFNTAVGVENYNANNVMTYTARYLLTENGGWATTLMDYTNNGKGWDSYLFGNRGAGLHFNVSEDWTQWSNEKLAQLGDSLSLIRMGNNGFSELTLNAEVVAQISNGGLRVQGASDKNDVLNLSGFAKATSSDVNGYDLYTASFDGEDLKLYVQANDSITTNIIG